MKKCFTRVFLIILLFGLPVIFLETQSVFSALPVQPPRVGENVTNWIAVDGTVTDFRYFEPSPGSPGMLTICYEYSVSGKNYKFETFRWFFFSDDIEVREIFNKYQKGSSIIVHYNPLNPQISYVLKLNPNVMY